MRTIAARLGGEEPDPLDLDFPTVEDGLAGVRFILGAVASGKRTEWYQLSER
jgi:hypothetical protein